MGIKGTERVISSEDSNDLFTTCLLTVEPLSDQKCERYCRFLVLKVFNSDKLYVFLQSNRNAHDHFSGETTIEEKSVFKNFKHLFLIHT